MEFTTSVNRAQSLAANQAPVSNHLTQSFITDDTSRTTDKTRYVCLEEGCKTTFNRCNEFARHFEDVHQPELKLSCPYPRCTRRFSPSRFHRLRKHYIEQHDSSTLPCPDLCTPKPFIDKVWGCGFCVTWASSWKDLAKHIWAHFQAGVSKENWNGSLYIQSLLQHPTVREAWLALATSSVGGRHMAWSDWDVKHLRADLEWLTAGRKQGSVLAKQAFDCLVPSASSDRDTSQSTYFDFSNPSVFSGSSSLETFVQGSVNPWSAFTTYPRENAYGASVGTFGPELGANPADNVLGWSRDLYVPSWEEAHISTLLDSVIFGESATEGSATERPFRRKQC